MFFLQRQLEFSIGGNHFSALNVLCEGARARQWQSCKECQKQKFDALVFCQHSFAQTWLQGAGGASASNWVVSQSSWQLTEDKCSVLSRELNFAVTPRRPPVPQMIAVIKDVLHCVDGQEADAVHTMVVSLFENWRLPPRNITPGESKALQ